MGHPKDPDDWLLKRNRKGEDHIDACVKGYICPAPPKKNNSALSNIHHIVCISCMADGTIEGFGYDDDVFEFIKKCLAKTDWKINDEPNCVGLPKKQAYVDKLAPPGWGTWPCHQVDHPAYLAKVSARLDTNIWSTLQDVAQDCNVKGKAIAKQLDIESVHWLGTLSGRPTAAAWATRKQNPKWYIPFSMYPAAALPRLPPPDWTDSFSSSMVGRLSELFGMI